jgi:hypothetical protein
MQYILHHDGLGLKHQLSAKDSQGAFLDFSPDAELGDDPTPHSRQADSG